MTLNERAAKIVDLVCQIVYDDMPTSFDGLDFSPIVEEIRKAIEEEDK